MHRIADVISTEARAKYNEAIGKDEHRRFRLEFRPQGPQKIRLRRARSGT
jgi:hypothetical protein